MEQVCENKKQKLWDRSFGLALGGVALAAALLAVLFAFLTGFSLTLQGDAGSLSGVAMSEKTDVFFYDLTENEIEEYISSSEPYDKAGSYAIQGKASLLVKGINGDYFNVVGLPMYRLETTLREQFGLSIW